MNMPSRTTLSLLAALSLSACTLAPYDGQVVRERAVEFRGFARDPAALVVIEAFLRNPNTTSPDGVWAAIDSTHAMPTAYPAAAPSDEPVYSWSKIVKLENAWIWRNNRARLRARIYIGADSGSADIVGVMFDERGLACLGARLDEATSASPFLVESSAYSCSEIGNGDDARQEVEIRYAPN